MERLASRLAECEEALGKPEVLSDQKNYRLLATEHAYLSEVVATWKLLLAKQNSLQENRELLKHETDQEFVELLREEIEASEKEIVQMETQLQHLLVPPDPNDNRDTIVEIRAGTGGDEAALFVGDVVRMYQYYATKKGWKLETLSASPSEVGGFKEYVMVLSGPNVYRFMRHEGGTHRVQRVPATETQGRVHTSAITVAVLLEPGAEEDFELDEKDLRIDTYRSSGAGGQHVNTTDSAVRVTHIPTGLVSYCQEERSQHKNKDKAMRLLKAKIVEAEHAKKQADIANERSTQVGSGDRSERIRTYNFSQNRVTDHRINLTLYNLNLVMEGELDDITSALVSHYNQKKLEAI
ncbi:MAG: peptide chain release factor 1 [Chlamydiales bacterium]|nr:peptide chain release factor 1 [Chlamydiales bacterium]